MSVPVPDDCADTNELIITPTVTKSTPNTLVEVNL